MNKEDEDKVVEIVEDCRLYRNAFILKRELVRKLEDAFPEVKNTIKKKNAIKEENKGGDKPW